MSFLIDITETKTYMQITGTASDALILMYIDLIEDEIETYVDRNLALGTYTEPLFYKQSTFDHSSWTPIDASNGAPSLFAQNYPIINNTFVLTSLGSPVTNTSYFLDLDNGVLRSKVQYSEPSCTYVAGYTTATTPKALKQVALQGVTSLFNNNKAASSGSGNVKSKSIKDFSVSYGNEQTANVISSNGQLVKVYLESNKHILDRFRRVNI